MDEIEWRLVHVNQIVQITELLDGVLKETTGVINTGITWKLESVNAQINALLTQNLNLLEGENT